MKKRNWKKWLLIAYIILSLPLVALGGFALVFMLVFSSLGGSFDFVPQDCIGMAISISGDVIDIDSQPIPDAVIEITSRPYGEDLDLTLTTDKAGHFEAGGNSTMFICNELYMRIDAEGYEQIVVIYAPIDNYSEETLPAPPIPIRLKIVLMEKL